MKRVWKCDFCSTTKDIEGKMTKHEEECSFSPANKRCYTCKHHESVFGMDGMDECRAGVDSETVFEMKEDDLSCEQWAGK